MRQGPQQGLQKELAGSDFNIRRNFSATRAVEQIKAEEAVASVTVTLQSTQMTEWKRIFLMELKTVTDCFG